MVTVDVQTCILSTQNLKRKKASPPYSDNGFFRENLIGPAGVTYLPKIITVPGEINDYHLSMSGSDICAVCAWASEADALSP